MIRKAASEVLQNKNSVMFITTLIFMAGVLSYFNNNAILCSAFLTLTAVIVLIKNYVSVKYVIFWILMFYFGFFISLIKIHSTDSLLPMAPDEASMTGQIISIPNSNVKNKTKFFVKVNKFDDKTVNAKTLVTAYNENGDFSNLTVRKYLYIQR